MLIIVNYYTLLSIILHYVTFNFIKMYPFLNVIQNIIASQRSLQLFFVVGKYKVLRNAFFSLSHVYLLFVWKWTLLPLSQELFL